MKSSNYKVAFHAKAAAIGQDCLSTMEVKNKEVQTEVWSLESAKFSSFVSQSIKSSENS